VRLLLEAWALWAPNALPPAGADAAAASCLTTVLNILPLLLSHARRLAAEAAATERMRAGATSGGGDARGRVRREFGQAVLGRLLPSFPAVAGVQVRLDTRCAPCRLRFFLLYVFSIEVGEGGRYSLKPEVRGELI
jgi:hypothetical protein